VQALLAGFCMSAARYATTEYDRLKGNDRGTHVYSPAHGGVATGAPRLAIDERSVLAGVKPEWIVYASCVQESAGLWRVGDVLATSAAALREAAPHVYEWTQ
jgi:hypothetical protein